MDPICSAPKLVQVEWIPAAAHDVVTDTLDPGLHPKRQDGAAPNERDLLDLARNTTTRNGAAYPPMRSVWELPRPNHIGAQACVRVLDGSQDVEGAQRKLRISLDAAHGNQQYVCLYGVSVLSRVEQLPS